MEDYRDRAASLLRPVVRCTLLTTQANGLGHRNVYADGLNANGIFARDSRDDEPVALPVRLNLIYAPYVLPGNPQCGRQPEFTEHRCRVI